MLHPTTVITEIAEDNAYLIPSGNLFVFPIEIDAGESKKIIAYHTSKFQQDLSLRVWVSTYVAGSQIISEDIDTGFWHLNRSAHYIVGLYDLDLADPEGIAARLPVPPGTYYLHVLNMTNLPNSFAYFLDATV